jgi:hypothetical protein
VRDHATVLPYHLAAAERTVLRAWDRNEADRVLVYQRSGMRLPQQGQRLIGGSSTLAASTLAISSCATANPR